MEEIKTVFITKYWETKGIYSRQCKMVSSMDSVTVYAKYIGPMLQGFYGPNDYFNTEKEAIEHVKRKAMKRISALETKIQKIRKQWL